MLLAVFFIFWGPMAEFILFESDIYAEFAFMDFVYIYFIWRRRLAMYRLIPVRRIDELHIQEPSFLNCDAKYMWFHKYWWNFSRLSISRNYDGFRRFIGHFQVLSQSLRPKALFTDAPNGHQVPISCTGSTYALVNDSRIAWVCPGLRTPYARPRGCTTL